MAEVMKTEDPDEELYGLHSTSENFFSSRLGLIKKLFGKDRAHELIEQYLTKDTIQEEFAQRFQKLWF